MTSINDAQRNSQADNAATDLTTATLTIYSGTPPASANAALSGNNPLVVHTLVGWQAAALGSAAANAIADETITGAGTQTATFARVELAGKIAQLLVGTDLVVSSTDYTNGGLSKINALTILQPAV